MEFTYRCLVYAERIWWHPGKETTIMTPPEKTTSKFFQTTLKMRQIPHSLSCNDVKSAFQVRLKRLRSSINIHFCLQPKKNTSTLKRGPLFKSCYKMVSLWDNVRQCGLQYHGTVKINTYLNIGHTEAFSQWNPRFLTPLLISQIIIACGSSLLSGNGLNVTMYLQITSQHWNNQFLWKSRSRD